MKTLLQFFIIALLIAVPGISFAETSSIGSARITYEKHAFSKEPTKEVKSKALEDAKLSAWKRYVSKFSKPKYKLYSDNENAFTGAMDTYISSCNILEEKTDTDNLVYTVGVKITINDVAVETKLSEFSAAGSNATGEGSLFSFVFLARETSSVKSFKDKETSVEMSQEVGTVEESAASHGGSAAEAVSKESMKKTVTGGNVEKKADKIAYTVSSSSDVDSAMNEILSPAGFEVVDYRDVLSECGGADFNTIKDEYACGSELSNETRREAINGCRMCEIQFFATGTLDVGINDIDPVSGMKRVYVSVNANVWNISGRLPRKVAAVGPIQYAGLGPDAVVAKRNALRKAAAEAATTIVDQMNAKKIN
ncbi:hypothetical protein GGQ74_002176 [Desulfobaculum xiamenense]|uniref:LPP20 lipoprotein n=1 Tax=Desulfobaculum xiamenense TaxID=995050 RepID=A0A846QQ87_9BACT|nr:hypothetical protein [Desulfobaculum xiamenense]NJB68503.1 hypothetical protein [Desulfobaculum xiamenense]